MSPTHHPTRRLLSLRRAALLLCLATTTFALVRTSTTPKTPAEIAEAIEADPDFKHIVSCLFTAEEHFGQQRGTAFLEPGVWTNVCSDAKDCWTKLSTLRAGNHGPLKSHEQKKLVAGMVDDVAGAMSIAFRELRRQRGDHEAAYYMVRALAPNRTRDLPEKHVRFLRQAVADGDGRALDALLQTQASPNTLLGAVHHALNEDAHEKYLAFWDEFVPLPTLNARERNGLAILVASTTEPTYRRDIAYALLKQGSGPPEWLLRTLLHDTTKATSARQRRSFSRSAAMELSKRGVPAGEAWLLAHPTLDDALTYALSSKRRGDWCEVVRKDAYIPSSGWAWRPSGQVLLEQECAFIERVARRIDDQDDWERQLEGIVAAVRAGPSGQRLLPALRRLQSNHWSAFIRHLAGEAVGVVRQGGISMSFDEAMSLVFVLRRVMRKSEGFGVPVRTDDDGETLLFRDTARRWKYYGYNAVDVEGGLIGSSTRFEGGGEVAFCSDEGDVQPINGDGAWWAMFKTADGVCVINGGAMRFLVENDAGTWVERRSVRLPSLILAVQEVEGGFAVGSDQGTVIVSKDGVLSPYPSEFSPKIQPGVLERALQEVRTHRDDDDEDLLMECGS